MKKFILNKRKLITFWSPVHYFLVTLSLLFGEASFIKKIGSKTLAIENNETIK